MKRVALFGAALLGATCTFACGESAAPPPATPAQAVSPAAAIDAGAPAATASTETAPPAAATAATPEVPDASSPTATADVASSGARKPPPAPSDVAAPPAEATKTPSGLAYHLLHASSDPQAKHPRRMSVVTVNYTGWTTDGKMFDSSLTDGTPAEFPLDRVIPGWTEGLQLMKVGESMRFWIPGNLAYDNPKKKAREGVPHGTLVFDVDLLGIK